MKTEPYIHPLARFAALLAELQTRHLARSYGQFGRRFGV